MGGMTSVLAASGTPLNQPEAATTPLDAPPSAAPAAIHQRPRQVDLKALERKLQEQANWQAFDLRGAALLNVMKICMEQGHGPDVTAEDMAQFRQAMDIANRWVLGDPNAE